MKNTIFNYIENNSAKLIDIADYIYDNPELGGDEFKALEKLTTFLSDNGFQIESGIADLPTAFRAVYKKGTGIPAIGLLCEYDALEGLGHGCAHHMQGPASVGAAIALKESLIEENFSIVVYGTPGEETFGGKINMIKHGFFNDIDVAIMMHGAPDTCTDIKCLALSSFTVTFSGRQAHAAIMPEYGRSAFDAMLLAFNATEFLREHTSDDTRLHYTMKELPGPVNIIPARAVGEFAMRSFSREKLDDVVRRFYNIIEGASLMTDTKYEITPKPALDNKIPVISLNNLILENARLAGADPITPPREKTGSTDFGNVMHMLPGTCLRVKFVPSGTSSHSSEYIVAGKTKDAHKAVIIAAKSMAGTAFDIISNPLLLKAIKEEFAKNVEIYK